MPAATPLHVDSREPQEPVCAVHAHLSAGRQHVRVYVKRLMKSRTGHRSTPQRLHAEVDVGVGDLAQGHHVGGRAVVVDLVVLVEDFADLVIRLPHGVVQT